MKGFESRNTAVVLIDVQEKLIPAMSGIDLLLNRVKLLVEGAGALGVDCIATEQYPKGLGHTLPEGAALWPP
ncbi:MAG: isochorismatase family protein, partial [Victivallaceae bacterium]|nr:isochorismatase family protein [Victivallaceae bacterium]